MRDDSLAPEIEAAVAGIRDDLQAAYEAREQALPLARNAIRFAATCIRAVHRRELERAEELLEQCRAAVTEATEALLDYPQILHAGFAASGQDAEYLKPQGVTHGLERPRGDVEVGLVG